MLTLIWEEVVFSFCTAPEVRRQNCQLFVLAAFRYRCSFIMRSCDIIYDVYKYVRAFVDACAQVDIVKAFLLFIGFSLFFLRKRSKVCYIPIWIFKGTLKFGSMQFPPKKLTMYLEKRISLHFPLRVRNRSITIHCVVNNMPLSYLYWAACIEDAMMR